MATYRNDHVSQAPSGSRLAQYLNGRNVNPSATIPSVPVFSSDPSRFNSNGQSMNGYNSQEIYDNGMGYANGHMGMASAGYMMSPAPSSGIGPSPTTPDMDMNRLTKNEELAAVCQNVPLVGLQVSNEDTLKQRWANTGHASFFTEPDLRNELMQRQLAMQCHQASSSDAPAVVEHLRNLRPIGRTPIMRYGPHMEHTYKAISVVDGLTYAVHRITNLRGPNAFAATQLEHWRRISHSNIVRLHEVLHTCAFNDVSFLFIYEFHPLSEPILKHFFHSNGSLKSKYTGVGVSGLSEQLAWSFIIQVSCAIRTVHSASMASRCIDLNRILVNSSGRFVLSGVGIADAMLTDPNPNLITAQIEDLRMFGAVLVALLNGSIQAATHDHISHAAQQIDTHYSPDLRNVVNVLCHAHASAPSRVTSINEIMPMIGARFYSQVEALQIRVDMLENDLCKELQNGRLFRLLCMLCTVSDRNLPKEPFWAEQSERYMLKLFRDYVFHQVDSFGRPILDLAHVVMSLNKLDSGMNEIVQLASSDNENILLVTYKELRSYLETSFEYLKREMEAGVSPELKNEGVVNGPGMLMPDGQNIVSGNAPMPLQGGDGGYVNMANYPMHFPPQPGPSHH